MRVPPVGNRNVTHQPSAASVIQELGVNPPAHGLERLWFQRPGDRAGEVVIFPHERGQAVPWDSPDRRFCGAGTPLEIDRELVVARPTHDELYGTPLQLRHDASVHEGVT